MKKLKSKDCIIYSDIDSEDLESEIIVLRSENFFLHTVIAQIKTACNEAEGDYNKDLKKIISIILSPFSRIEHIDLEEEDYAE